MRPRRVGRRRYARAGGRQSARRGGLSPLLRPPHFGHAALSLSRAHAGRARRAARHGVDRYGQLLPGRGGRRPLRQRRLGLPVRVSPRHTPARRASGPARPPLPPDAPRPLARRGRRRGRAPAPCSQKIRPVIFICASGGLSPQSETGRPRRIGVWAPTVRIPPAADRWPARVCPPASRAGWAGPKSGTGRTCSVRSRARCFSRAGGCGAGCCSAGADR